MLTEPFYSLLADLIKSGPRDGPLYLAIGRGQPLWDRNPPTPRRQATHLRNEIFRKAVNADDMVFIDVEHRVSETPTPRLRIRAAFEPGEGQGALRECGLFAGASAQNANQGVLLSYFVHPRIEKTRDMQLQREVILNLAPGQYRLEGHVSRYLGNAKTEELHDLENETTGCQIDEIRIDRRAYFATPQQALALGYDHCAFCFGRELSQR